jgi:hypothetical protein
VPTWHLFFLLPQCFFDLPPRDETTWHKEMHIQLKHFLTSNWENM